MKTALLVLVSTICGGFIISHIDVKVITKKKQEEARRYLDTLATNWTRIETQAVKDGDDCFMCWQAQALVNLAFILVDWEYAESVARRIGMLTGVKGDEKNAKLDSE